MNIQIRELAMAYGVTAAAMLVGLLVMRADRRAYFRWPAYSAMVMALGVMAWNLLRQHIVSPDAAIIHARLLYFSALALYALLGLLAGLGLGRLTRPRDPYPPEA